MFKLNVKTINSKIKSCGEKNRSWNILTMVKSDSNHGRMNEDDCRLYGINNEYITIVKTNLLSFKLFTIKYRLTLKLSNN